MSKFDAWDYLDKKKEKEKEEEEKKKTSGDKKTFDAWGYLDQKNAVSKINFDTFSDDLNTMNTTLSGIYGGWQDADTMAKTRDSVSSFYDRLSAYEDYRKNYGTEEDELPDLSELRGFYKTSLDDWDNLTNMYGQYSNADAYDKAVKALEDQQKKHEEMKTADLDSLNKEVTNLEGLLSTAKEYEKDINGKENQKKTFESRSRGIAPISSYGVDKVKSDYNEFLANTGYSSADDIEKAIAEKKSYIGQATRIQDGIALSAVANKESEKYDKDFEKFATIGETIDNDNKWWEGQKNPVAALRNNPVALEMYEDDMKEHGAMYESVVSSQVTYLMAKYGTDDEVKTYYYYLGKADEESANKYLEAMTDELRNRQATDIAGSKDSAWKKYSFGYTAGIDQFTQGTINLFNTEDDYIPTTGIQRASGLIREDIEKDHGFLGTTGYDLITTSSNMLPSILTSTVVSAVATPAVGAGVGTALMGASASGNAYQEMLNLGYDKRQSRVYSTLVGVSEAGLQYALGGIGKLGGVSGKLSKAVSGIDNAIARFAIQYGGSMLSEGFEEAAQEVLTPLFKSLATAEDIEAIDWEQVAYSGLLGMLSGGVMEGPSLAINTAAEQHTRKTAGANIRTNEKIGETLELASLSPEESSAYQAYTAYANKGINADNIKDVQLGRLATSSMEDALSVIKSKDSTPEQRAKAERILQDLDAYIEDTKVSDFSSDVKDAYKDKDSVKALIQSGLEGDKDSESYKLAKEYRAKLIGGKKLSDKEISKLSDLIAKEEMTETANEVKERLTELGEIENIDKIAEAISKRAMGHKLTSAENALIENSEYGSEVAREFISDLVLAKDEFTKASPGNIRSDALTNEMRLEARSGENNANAELMEYADGVDEENRQLFIDTYDGKMPLDEYAKAFTLVNDFAKENAEGRDTQDILLKNSAGLTPAQIAKIYGAAVVAPRLAQQKAIDKLVDARKGKLTYKANIDDSVIDYDNKGTAGKVNWNSLTSKQRNAITFVKGFAKGMGINLKFVTDGAKEGYNGMYVKEENTIYIDVHAGVENFGGILTSDTIIGTLSHEVTHWAKNKAPALYAELSNKVFSVLSAKRGLTEFELIAEEQKRLKKKYGKEFSAEYARDEIIARACEDILTMSEEGKKMFSSLSETEQKSLVAKIKEVINDILKWIDDLLKLYKSNSSEAVALRDMQEELQDIVKVWDEMLVSARDANAALEAGDVSVSNTDSTSEKITAEVGKTEKKTVEKAEEKAEEKTEEKGNVEQEQTERIVPEEAQPNVIKVDGNTITVKTSDGKYISVDGTYYGKIDGRDIFTIQGENKYHAIDSTTGLVIASAQSNRALKKAIKETAESIRRTSEMEDESIKAAYGITLEDVETPFDDMPQENPFSNEEASEVFGELHNGISKDGTTIIGEGNVQMSERTYREGGRDYLVNWLKRQKGLTKEDKDDIVRQTDKVAEIMRAVAEGNELPDYSRWANWEVVKDEKGEKVLSVIVKNGDYTMNIDFSQVCKKRVALNAVLNAMVQSGDLNVHVLTETDVADLNAIIKKHDFEIACALCFVDSKRYRVGAWAESFCEGVDTDDGKHKYGFNEMVRSLVPKGSKLNVDEFNFTKREIEGQPTKNLLSDAKDSQLDFTLIDKIMSENDVRSAQHRYARAIKENPQIRKILNSAEIISSIGLDAIRLEAPALYSIVNGHQGTAKPKFSHDAVAYGNDVLKARGFTAKKAKMVGGVRCQSFSDFMANMVMDYAQFISELSAKQMTAHSYTKEPLFVKLFGLTGMKINMSLVPKAVDMTAEQQKQFAILKDKNADKNSAEYKAALEEYEKLAENAGLDENGNYIWEDETFPYDIAMEIVDDPRYSANCGTIAVGISKAHILKLLADSKISMVIPYHKSGLNRDVAMMRDIALYHDYTSVQNTRYGNDEAMFGNDAGKKLDKDKGDRDFDFYGDLYGKGKKDGTHDPKKTAQNYLDWCDKHNFTPKFDEFRDNPNYYKLLVDFRVYDTDGTYREQQAVKAIYPGEAEFKDLILNGVKDKDGKVYGGLLQSQENSDRLKAETSQIVDEYRETLKEKYGKDVLVSNESVQFSERNSPESNSMKEQIRNNQDKLNEMNVIASIITDKKFKNAKEAFDWALEMLKQSGYKSERLGFGTVIFDEKRLKNALRYIKSQEDFIAFAFIPKVIKNGIAVGNHPNHKERGYGTITFAAPIEIDGVRFDMAVVVRMEGKNYYKLHRVLMPDGRVYVNKKRSNAERAAATTSVVDTPTDITSVKSLSHLDAESNEEIVNNEGKQLSERSHAPTAHEVMGELKTLENRYKKLEADYGRLKEKLKIEKSLTKGKLIVPSQIDAVARHLLKFGDSNYSKDELVKMLNDLYVDLQDGATNDSMTWDEMYSKAYEVAEAIRSEAKVRIERPAYYDMILKDIRSARIAPNEGQKGDAKHRFGDHYVGKFRGRVTIANDGVHLDEKWSEWASKYPSVFDKDIGDAQQLVELYDIYDDLRNAGDVVQEYEESEVLHSLATEIVNKAWLVTKYESTADKYDKKIKELNFEHRKAMEELKDTYKKKESDAKLLGQMYYGRLINDIKTKRHQEVARAKELGRERLAQYKENAERKVKIQSITNNSLTLNKWLVKNSKDEHIHEALKTPVINLLNAIDFSSKRMVEQNIPTNKDISLAKTLGKVKDMMVKASNGHADFVQLYGHGLDEKIEKMMESIDMMDRTIADNEFILQKMSLEDLDTLDKMVKTIKHSVSKLNKFHVANHAKGIAHLSQMSVMDMDSLGKGKTHSGMRGKIDKTLMWNNALPAYAFERFGEGGKLIFEAVQDGWDKFAFNVKAALDYAEGAYTSKEVQEWEKDVKTFKILVPTTEADLADPDYKPEYQKVQMTIPQVMSLYCMQKREQAKGHILGGGIRVADFSIKKKLGEEVITQEDGAVLTAKDIESIIGTLTDRQKAVADKLQAFMNTTCTEWGNEVSLARFGYKAFGEENYFPIKSDDNNISSEPNDVETSLFRLLNMSFTKSLTEGANNRVVIGNIFDVFAQHASDMAKYNALALPVLDAYKWYSYTEKQDVGDEGNFKTQGVKQAMEKAFGKNGQNYFTTFLKDINGQKEVSRDTLGGGFFTNAKIAAVGANLRVVALQPTSYLRASAVIDNKYLAKAFAHKPKIEKAEKYCGIALWKSMGYYDTNIQRGVTEQIKHSETWKDKATELSMKGAEVADKITWGYLWNACELEIRDTRKDLKVGSEEFYNAIAKRLREVIYKTQVVDSTLTRSQMMRSSDGRDKFLTAFASEPTLSYNMLVESLNQAKLDARRIGKDAALKKHGGTIARTIAAYTVTNAVAALVESAFDAFRDTDDDDENDLIYFMKLYLSNFAQDMSVVGKIPYIKEAVSLIKGFSSSRTDVQWMEAFTKAAKEWGKIATTDKGNPMKAIRESFKAFSYASGLPFYNGIRDIMAGLDTFNILEVEDLEEMLRDIFE